MRTLQELIDTNDAAWPLIQQWIAKSTRPVTVLSKSSQEIAEQTLVNLQATTRTTLGAIIYESGGLIIDNGWLKVFGGGHNEQIPALLTWNESKTILDNKQNKGLLIIAIDAIGGHFCINGGALGEDLGMIYYFAPDTLDYEPLDMGYSQLIQFFLSDNVDKFYQDFRWTNWQEEVKVLQLDEVFSFVPPLWTVEGKNIEESSKKPISATEQYFVQTDFREGLNDIENKYL